MAWHWTMLVFNCALLALFIALFQGVPDAARRIALGLLVASTSVLIFGDFAAVTGQYWHWMFTKLAREVEHIAIIVYTASVFITEQEKRCLPNCSTRFHNLPRL